MIETSLPVYGLRLDQCTGFARSAAEANHYFWSDPDVTAWSDKEFGEQPAAPFQLSYSCTLLDGLKTLAERNWYSFIVSERCWSRDGHDLAMARDVVRLSALNINATDTESEE
jgi:hypothetical protein